MTCVMGFRFYDGIFMIADSAGTDENDFQTSRIDSKVFLRDDTILFGISGSFRMRDILMYNLKIPKRGIRENTDKYVRTKLIEAIRDLFLEKGFSKIENNEQSFDGDILIGIDNKLYHIESDFQVGEDTAMFCAIGSGQELATGAMAMYLNINPDFCLRSISALSEIIDVAVSVLNITCVSKSSVKAPFNTKFIKYNQVLSKEKGVENV